MVVATTDEAGGCFGTSLCVGKWGKPSELEDFE
jgi:hypothetical protein